MSIISLSSTIFFCSVQAYSDWLGIEKICSCRVKGLHKVIVVIVLYIVVFVEKRSCKCSSQSCWYTHYQICSPFRFIHHPFHGWYEVVGIFVVSLNEALSKLEHLILQNLHNPRWIFVWDTNTKWPLRKIAWLPLVDMGSLRITSATSSHGLVTMIDWRGEGLYFLMLYISDTWHNGYSRMLSRKLLNVVWTSQASKCSSERQHKSFDTHPSV